jgi:hypothetical protein
MSEPTTPCATPEARQFDFWLGRWDLTWPAEQAGGEPGETMTGTNWIDRLFGQCVIEESFSNSDDSFQGRSLSVYDPGAGLWRQTWVDSAGGYLVFTGGFDGAKMVLSTEPAEHDGATMVSRMVFSDITEDSLYWEWQKSEDGGKTWADRWTINYTRRS